MKTLLALLQQQFYQALKQAFPGPELGVEVIEITPSTQASFGHYQCNSAMKLAKSLQLAPREIAQRLTAHLQLSTSSGESFIAAIEIAGPGFINITLATEYLNQRLQEILVDSCIGAAKPEHNTKVIIDFSSPNIAKEMHVGHLRSTIIGDCLARLFEFLQYDVLRLNHVGDWGTAFGMLIAYLKAYQPKVLAGEEQADLTQLMDWYRQAKQQFDSDVDFKKRSQLQVVALQSGEQQARRAWEIICEISRHSYQAIYDLLDVKLIERGESFYNPYLAEIIQDLTAKGLLQISDGAKCMFIPGFVNREGEPLPLILQKSDGGYNYATTDMAAIRHRVQMEKGQRLIYVTDAGQASHFAMIFKAAELAGYVDPQQVQCDHVPFGLVLGPDGKKFKTRSGETERLIDLLYAAIEKAKTILQQRDADLTGEELLETAKVLGINAVKYADLSTHRGHDYAFSYERMLRFEGNTAAFLMYAYVRIASIKRKASSQAEKGSARVMLQHPTEVALGLQICQFAEVLEQIARDLMPNRLTDYLFTLAEKFNAFFRDCQVIGSEQQASRLLLCEATARVLKQGMQILGLQMLEKM
jgi:arginyl-tRNA synthetase